MSAPTTTPNADPSWFTTCEVLPEQDAVRVRPIGSLDIATVPVLEQQLQVLREAGFTFAHPTLSSALDEIAGRTPRGMLPVALG